VNDLSTETAGRAKPQGGPLHAIHSIHCPDVPATLSPFHPTAQPTLSILGIPKFRSTCSAEDDVNPEGKMPGQRGLRCGQLASIVGLVVAAAAGCSTRVAYDAVQNRQRLECQKIQDLSARSKCLADASTPYEDYKRQSESAKSAK
jgi:hypothetical protein